MINMIDLINLFGFHLIAISMSRPGHRDRERDKYESPNPRRTHSIMSPEDVAAGKKSFWQELEITGMKLHLLIN